MKARKIRNEIGASIVEFGLIIALIAVTGIVSVSLFGDELCCLYTTNAWNVENSAHVQCKKRIDGASNCPEGMVFICEPILDACPQSEFQVCSCQVE